MAFAIFFVNDIVILTNKNNTASVADERAKELSVFLFYFYQTVGGNPAAGNNICPGFKAIFKTFVQFVFLRLYL